MRADGQHKYELAKSAITTTAVAVMFILGLWLLLQNSPTSLRASVDLQNGFIEFNCDFASEDNNE